MWYAGCIMHYLPEHPYAGSFEDPYDEFRFRSILDEEGAIGVYPQEADVAQLAGALNLNEDELRKNVKEFSFPYSAPYGKKKDRHLFLVVIPPRNSTAQTTQAQAQD
jgi:hypothetical protein